MAKKRTISAADFGLLDRLLQIARSLRLAEDQVLFKVLALTGDDDESGWCTDAVYSGGITASQLCGRLDLEIRE
jgi:hypothetical protein